ncbi:MAG TPA: hypothetical protein VLW26_05435 [Steroidobacteraceae bacterium]|nr:hypothetical protein [Steroidobacteraceae bacterium]
MSIETYQGPESFVAHAPRRLPASAGRGSSRMLESYLGDIEYLMREGLWEEAEPLALALPHICCALANSELHSSRERFLVWCETWVRPLERSPYRQPPTPAQLLELAQAHDVAEEIGARSAVPSHALRQLRLRRLSRAAPARRRMAMADEERRESDAPLEVCAALVEAVRRWYSDWAGRQATVQMNLARLAVLR